VDWTSVLGLALGVAALLGAQLMEGGGAGALLQPTAALIVLGGTAGATILSAPRAELLRAVRMLRRLFIAGGPHPRETARRLVEMATLARKEGIIALEGPCAEDPHPFVRIALRQVVDGAGGQPLRDLLETDVHVRTEKALAAARVFETAGGFAPTLGILGAVLGLIHVMGNLQEPGRLGDGIAVAFVATIYGVGIANLVLLPVASRLQRLAMRDQSTQEMIVEAALAIQSGLAPSAVADRLEAWFRRPLDEPDEAP